jgi:hypothetical protein
VPLEAQAQSFCTNSITVLALREKLLARVRQGHAHAKKEGPYTYIPSSWTEGNDPLEMQLKGCLLIELSASVSSTFQLNCRWKIQRDIFEMGYILYGMQLVQSHLPRGHA